MKNVFVFLLTLVISFNLSINYLQACSFAGSPWYIATVNINELQLPKELQVVDDTLNYPGLVALELLNTTDTPIEFIRLNDSDTSLSEIKTTDYFSRYRLASGKTFMYMYGSNGNSGWTWIEYGETLRLDSYSIDDLIYEEANEQKPTWNKTGDNRPLFVKIPDPESYNLVYLKNNIAKVLPITITYTLNKKYNPNSVKEGSEVCNNFNNYVYGVPELAKDYSTKTIYMLILLGTALLIIRHKRSNRKNKR